PAPSRRTRVAALVLAALGALTYEGIGVLAVAVAVVAAWHGPGGRARIRRVGGTIVLFAAIAGWMLDHSQKAGMLHAFAHTSLLVSIHFGRGVLPSPLLPLGFAVMLTVAYA